MKRKINVAQFNKKILNTNLLEKKIKVEVKYGKNISSSR